MTAVADQLKSVMSWVRRLLTGVITRRRPPT